MAAVRHQIAALVGGGSDRGLDVRVPAVPPAVHDLPAGVTTDLIGRRPDIRASRARVEAAASRIKVAHAAFYPAINLSALIGFQALGFGNLVKTGSVYGNAGPALTLPLFDGGALAGRFASARADYDKAVATYDRTVIDAFREVADAVAARGSLIERAAQARQALDASEQAYRIARSRYEGGLSAYLDVLTAEQAVLVARRTNTDLNSRRFSLDVALVRALGGGATLPAQKDSRNG